MPLKSKHFTTYQRHYGDTDRKRLEDVLRSDGAYITPREPVVSGDHIRQIQLALQALGQTTPTHGRYDFDTAQAVRQYKSKHNPPILNQRLGQTKREDADAIIGIGTMGWLDADMVTKDGAKPAKPPAPSPSPAPKDRRIKWLNEPNAAAPIKIKEQDEAKAPRQDLEFAPRGSMPPLQPTLRALNATLPGALILAGLRNSDFAAESALKAESLAVGRADHLALTLAKELIANTVPIRVIAFPTLASRFPSEPTFVANRNALEKALQAALSELLASATTDASGATPVDVARLALPETGQPKALSSFASNIEPSFKRLKRVPTIADDTVLWATVGAIKGLLVEIVSFSGSSDGNYKGELRFTIFDHYGSGDDDLFSVGQYALWHLQRGMVAGQDTTRYKPFISKFVVNDVPFNGKI